jgi:methyl-accepting chemotaxis protein
MRIFMRNNISIRTAFTYFGILFLAIVGLLSLALGHVSSTQAQLVNVSDNRYQSYLLADELRQSSDDLTRLARTYVVTGDAKYEQQYNDILDIRNGKKARPKNPERIYWDFVAAGNAKPREDGAAVALQDLMKKAGFSDEEFAKLKEAQGNSDDLVKTEVIAMNAVKGLFDDGSGKFTVKKDPDPEMARKLMHSNDYHQFKAKIMKPLDDFFVLLDQRTAKEVELAQSNSQSAYWLVSVLLAASVCALGIGVRLLYSQIRHQVGGEPKDAAAIAHLIAEGDLSTPIHTDSTDPDSVIVAMKTMREKLASTLQQVSGGTDAIANAAAEIAQGNSDLSSRTESQAGTLEETASSMEEMTVTVKQNADNARQANQLVLAASEIAVKGGNVVAEVVTTMGAINDSSKKIVDIISVIDGIAFQTNILALNAAVEAARAGEQGRGFAVVASEVRSLAQRSAAAAKEIKELIGNSVGKVDEGARLVDQAGQTMEEIVQSVRRVTDIMGEISSASAEQTTEIEQINRAVNHMDESTQQNAALVEQASAAAESMQEQASKLAQLVSVFKFAGGSGFQHNTQQQLKRQVPAPIARKATASTPRPRKPAVKQLAKNEEAPRKEPQMNGATEDGFEEF